MAGDGNCPCGRSSQAVTDFVCSCDVDGNSKKESDSLSNNNKGSCIAQPLICSHTITMAQTNSIKDCESSNSTLKLNREKLTYRRQMKGPFRTGSAMFIEELQFRTFCSADEIALNLLPSELNTEYFQANGFTSPIVMTSTDGIGLKMPPSGITFSDIEALVGGNIDIEVINVTHQTDEIMKLADFIKYMLKPKRTRVLNVLSLECSDMKLGTLIKPPTVAEQIDWVNLYWPSDINNPLMKQKPKVQKYCLMAPKGAYTDFHIDFGGSSVWYHVMKGEKVFYLIEPSESNLLLYDRWMQSSNRLQSFFADQVARCYRLVVKEGMTILLPSGWIHAVFTPEDTLVFGGNFLHNYSICTQLQIYEFEIKHKMEARFLFPQFKTLNWLAAGHLINVLTSINQTRSIAPVYLTKGLKSLWFSLKQWKTSPLGPDDLSDEDGFRLSQNYTDDLLKSISKEVKRAQKISIALNPPQPIRESTRIKKKPIHKDFILYDHSVSDNTATEAYSSISNSVNNEKNPSDKILRTHQKKNLKLTVPPPLMYPYLNESKLVTNLNTVNTNNIPMGISPLEKFHEDEFKFLLYTTNNNHDNKTNFCLTKQSGELSSKITNVPRRNDTSASTSTEKFTHHSDGSCVNTGDFQYSDTSSLDSTSGKNWKILFGNRKIVLSKGKKDVPSTSLDISHVPFSGDVASSSEMSNDENNLRIDESGLSTSSSFNNYSEALIKKDESAPVILGDHPINVRTSESTSSSLSSLIAKPEYMVRGNMTEEDASFSAELDLHEVHQDDEYVYPSFCISSDEEEEASQRKRDLDASWCPRIKIKPVSEKANRPVRQGTMKLAVEKGLEAAKKRLQINHEIAETFVSSKKTKAVRTEKDANDTKNKKPKKGFATPKQRLGKILKLHKLIN